MTEKKHKEKPERVVEVDDLSFLYDPEHFSWLEREKRHFRLKRALKRADRIIALNPRAALDLHKYYRVPSERIEIKA